MQPALQTKDKKVDYRLITAGWLLAAAREGRLSPWQYNRATDEARVIRMLRDQVGRLEKGQPFTLFLPVPITVCRLGGVTYLMDGQHRLAVLQRLSDTCPAAVAGVQLALCTVECREPGDLEDVFIRINSGTPVPAAYYAQKVSRVLDEYLHQLRLRYPHAESDAEHPQKPRFNLRRTRDAMSSHLELRDAIIDGWLSAERLLEVTEHENRVEAAFLAAPGAARMKTPSSRCLKYAASTGFYLGLRDGWALTVSIQALLGGREEQALLEQREKRAQT
jgi:hypothetical protein